MAEPQADMSDVAAEAAADFFNQIFGVVIEAVKRFARNLYHSFADVSMQRWTKVICSVIFYIVIRPYIQKFFQWINDKEREKEKRKKEEAKAKLGGRKAKLNANALRGGAGEGKVLGEVDTEDELEDGEENMAQASGVPEWNGMARKRQKKYLKQLKKQNEQGADDLTEEQIMELLDWSDDEVAKKDE